MYTMNLLHFLKVAKWKKDALEFQRQMSAESKNAPAINPETLEEGSNSNSNTNSNSNNSRKRKKGKKGEGPVDPESLELTVTDNEGGASKKSASCGGGIEGEKGRSHHTKKPIKKEAPESATKPTKKGQQQKPTQRRQQRKQNLDGTSNARVKIALPACHHPNQT